jgi:hypothetical protein
VTWETIDRLSSQSVVGLSFRSKLWTLLT